MLRRTLFFPILLAHFRVCEGLRGPKSKAKWPNLASALRARLKKNAFGDLLCDFAQIADTWADQSTGLNIGTNKSPKISKLFSHRAKQPKQSRDRLFCAPLCAWCHRVASGVNRTHRAWVSTGGRPRCRVLVVWCCRLTPLRCGRT